MVKLNELIKKNDLNHGIYEGNSKTTYDIPAMVFGSDGNLYRALTNSTNKNPISNPDIGEDIISKLTELIIQVRDSAFPIGGICAGPSLNNFPNFGVTGFECDGSEYNTVVYSDLYYVLGTNKLPDYRGVFLRRIWTCYKGTLYSYYSQ